MRWWNLGCAPAEDTLGPMNELLPCSTKRWAQAVLLGVVLCIALTGSTWADLGTQLPGFYNDDWANGIYLHHQVHLALSEGRFDLADPNQFFPFGYNPIHTNGGNVLEMLVSGVCRLVLPWPLWLSVGALLWVPLNLLAFIPLGRRLWDSWAVVLAGAATWALFPPVLEHLAAGRLTQVALVGVPLAVAGFLDLAERGGRRAIWLTAGGWVLTGLGYWFNALFLGLLAPVFWVYGRGRRGGAALAKDLVKSGMLALVMVAPLLGAVAWPVISGSEISTTHIDPTEMNSVFPDALKLVGGQLKGMVNWLPWSMLLGILIFAWKGRRVGLWLALGGLAVMCALGPGQQIGDTVYRMPYWLLWKGVPGLARMLHPDRWMLLAGVFLAVAAVDGVGRWMPKLAWLVPVGVLVQLWVRGVAPLGAWSPEVPEHWAALADGDSEGAVIVVPVHQSQLAGQYQRVHGRPLYGGMLEDQPWTHPKKWRAYGQSSAFLSGLRLISYGREEAIRMDPEDLSKLYEDGFRRVVYDHASWVNSPRRTNIDLRTMLADALGPPMFECQSGSVWLLPTPSSR